MSSELTKKRERRATVLNGESADQATFLDADKEYEVKIYNIVMDNVVQSMNECFIKHEALYNDFAGIKNRAHQ